MERSHPASREGWHRVERLAGDASTRTFSRLTDGGRGTMILAEYPAGEARRVLGRDVEVLRWCGRRGLRVPSIYDHDPRAGWLLLEDLGSADAADRLRAAGPSQRAAMLAACIAPLARLAAIDPNELPAWNRPLDAARLRWELAGFELWYLRHGKGIEPSLELAAWLDRLADEVAHHPRRVCHRDFHLNNLFFLATGEAALIDVQDILVGPDTYDAVSMVSERSALELLDDDTRRQWLARWAEATGAAPGWRDRWPRVLLQRSLKVLGTFARLSLSERPRYRRWMERVARRLLDDAGDLELPPPLIDHLVD